ncbi:serine hydrolase [[Phormidium] sp. ETS-05]|uniref:serine hydrolase n=1 Tax=[Phormidium] sp. ETS-05 TaxID=222819 RepID=UPI0018EF0691|nr:serine hydrolase [[Phormidium] sp. ETS-05]
MEKIQRLAFEAICTLSTVVAMDIAKCSFSVAAEFPASNPTPPIPELLLPRFPKPIFPDSPPPADVYNFRQPPVLTPSEPLQAIANQVVQLVTKRGLPAQDISISLINLKNDTSAGYLAQKLRYPASVAKFFWLVEAYAQLEAGTIARNGAIERDLSLMIRDSDNAAASRVVDRLTGTTSGSALTGASLEDWQQHRWQLTQFFLAAGFDGIFMSQKNYPIPGYVAPSGRDEQLQTNPSPPIWNRATTEQTARLMYDLVRGRAVSSNASQEMLDLLTRKLPQPNDIMVKSFFSESLQFDQIKVAHKVGWTRHSRCEVAYIYSIDRSREYILVIFSEGAAYAADDQIFPQISRLVYDRLAHFSDNDSISHPHR